MLSLTFERCQDWGMLYNRGSRSVSLHSMDGLNQRETKNRLFSGLSGVVMGDESGGSCQAK